MTIRRRGVLRPHEHVDPSLGWSIELGRPEGGWVVSGPPLMHCRLPRGGAAISAIADVPTRSIVRQFLRANDGQ
jgi:hypothetical protein